jgi:hypothetical protein
VEGRTDSLKERALGVAIFERPPDYDTSQDPIVRNTAGQVRKRLAQYYHEHGHQDELRIDIPAGSYVPEFSIPATPALLAPAPNPEPPIRPRPKRWPWIAAAAALFLAIAIYFRPVPAGPVDQFWNPVFEHPSSIVCVTRAYL